MRHWTVFTLFSFKKKTRIAHLENASAQNAELLAAMYYIYRKNAHSNVYNIYVHVF